MNECTISLYTSDLLPDHLIEVMRADEISALIKFFPERKDDKNYAVVTQPTFEHSHMKWRTIEMFENEKNAQQIQDNYNQTVKNEIREEHRKNERISQVCRIIDNNICNSMSELYHYDLGEALAKSIEECSEEEVRTATALTVVSYDWDGRLSNANKEWAKEVVAGTGYTEEKLRNIRLCTTHLAVFNGFVDTFKKYEAENQVLDLTDEQGRGR